MKVSIFIRTYIGDAKWLDYCLQSIQKFCADYHEVVVAIPEADAPAMREWVEKYGARVVVCKDHKDGYLSQQITKLQADLYCTGDFILLVDSDCVMLRWHSPEVWMDPDKGTPYLLVSEWDQVGDAICWRPITTKALGFEPPFETMRRIPLMYPRSIFPVFRAYMQAVHNASIEEYIERQPYREFSEFNALGSYVVRCHPQLFSIVRADQFHFDPVTNPCKQFWSWGGITPEIEKEIHEMLGLITGTESMICRMVEGKWEPTAITGGKTLFEAADQAQALQEPRQQLVNILAERANQ